MTGGLTQKPYTGRNRREPDRWHVERGVPLTVIITLIVQTFIAGWFMAGMKFTLETQAGSIQEIKAALYTQSDAKRDAQVLAASILVQQGVERELDRRISALEIRVDRVVNSK